MAIGNAHTDKSASAGIANSKGNSAATSFRYALITKNTEAKTKNMKKVFLCCFH